MSYKVSDKENVLLAEIVGYIKRNGYPPTQQYLMDTLKMSQKTVRKFIKRFEAEGKLQVERYKTRGIILSDRFIAP